MGSNPFDSEGRGYGLQQRLSHNISSSLPSGLGTEISVQGTPGEVRLREIIRQVCAKMGVTIVHGVLSRDHVHMFVEIPPHVLVSDFVPPCQGPVIAQNPAGVRTYPQALPGPTLLATRILFDHLRQHHR